ncbi:MAG: peptidylprolyl isomerase [Alphaproteobacteria bacterium]|nr:peptidylprolyl isomerase [Alphaproteobacteria bacterium]
MLCFFLLLPLAASAEAEAKENNFTIIALVGEEPITRLDVENRASFMIASAGIPDTPETHRKVLPQALRSLIDEKVQLQEAARLKLNITDKELEIAIAAIERQNRMGPGAFKRFIEEKGVDEGTAMQQVRSQVALSKLVRQKVQGKVSISDSELALAMERAAAGAGDEFRISRIVIPIDDASQEEQSKQLAEQLASQAKGGADFPKLARQFSTRAINPEGEEGSWVMIGQLDKEVETVLKPASAGAILGPVRTAEGYQVIQVIEKKGKSGVALESEVALWQAQVPVAPNASTAEWKAAQKKAEELREGMKGCRGGTRDPLITDLGRIQVKNLQNEVRNVVQDLKVGEPTPPLRSTRGLMLVVVCERIEAEAPMPEAAKVKDALMQAKMDREVRRYIRDLRRSAVIDIRVR